MAKSTEALISEIRSRVHTLLHDEVIQHTIVVMRELGNALGQLARLTAGGATSLSEQQKTDLINILVPLTSESIREALHKGELPITNGIIRSKNQIFTAIGAPIPDGHAEIDARNFPNYTW